jgi:hypothetical protein
VRECSKADGGVADTLQGEQKEVSVISDALRLPARYSRHIICSYSFTASSQVIVNQRTVGSEPHLLILYSTLFAIRQTNRIMRLPE